MKKILTISCLLVISFRLDCQIDTSINGDLRALITPLKRANCQAPFHFDMVAHLTDDKFYKPIVTDTTSTLNWRAIHFEMAQSSFSPNLLPHDTIVSDQITIMAQMDKVPLGLMDLDYNMFRSDAFDSSNFGRWFFWDNDSIWDNPSRIDEPYELNQLNPSRGSCLEVFQFSPLIESSHFRNVTFTIDPGNFFFYNGTFSANVSTHPNPHTFQIDFKDGLGWRSFDPFVFQEISIVYPNKGIKNIAARVVLDGLQVIKFSISTFLIETDALMVLPDFTIENEFVIAGVYKGCNTDSTLKPLIYLEGIDIGEVRNIPRIFNDMIRDESLIMLHNYNYDYVVVNWKNSTIDMRDNAMGVVNLIDRLKVISDTTHQFVVIGESMGGVIGRFALTFMETSGYRSKTLQDSAFFRQHRLHNTRLFISYDSPHQGANIPIAIQQFNEWIYEVPRPLIRTALILSDIYRNTNALGSNLLKRDAIKQLLITHAHTRNASGCYTAHPMRTAFMDQLVAMNPSTGGYPSQCKLVALSNGLMDGSGQAGFRNRVIQANERILQLDYRLTVRIFRLIPIPLVSFDDAIWRGNPNGSGNVINIPLRWNVFGKVRGCIINIFKKTNNPCNILGVGLPYNLDVCNVQALDPFPGGKFPAASMFINDNVAARNSSFNIWIWRHVLDVNPANGSIFLKAQAGIFFPQRVVLNGEADIADFCFIPLQSALDYKGLDQFGNPLPQNHDILNTTVGENMNRTPFHVIVGQLTNSGCFPNPNGTSGCSNFPHLAMRNPQFGTGGPFLQNLSWLTREIGEEEMRLDNMTMAREGTFQAKNILNAGNSESNFYSYPMLNPPNSILGIHSDSQRFIIGAFDAGEVKFTAGTEIRLRPGFESRRGSNFRARIELMNVCLLTRDEIRDVFSAPIMQEEELGIDHKDIIKNSCSIFPNPSNGIINIKSEGIKNVKIYSLQGQLLYNSDFGNVGTISLQPNISNSGLLLIKVTTSNGIFRNKLILNNH
jgi:hypothetical protein